MNNRTVFSGLLIASAFVATTANAQTLRQVVALTENEQFAKASSMFRTLLTTDATSGEVWFQYGENFFQWDKQDSANYCYKKGVEVNPRYPLGHVGLGKILWVKGDTAQARVQFQNGINTACDKANKFPKELQAQTFREVAEALIQGNIKNTKQAMAQVDKALSLDPNDPESYIVKGDIQFEENPSDASKPLVNYKRAIELAPMAARPVAKKALMYHRGANYTAAITEYTAAITKDPSFAPAYTGRAESYFMDRKYDLATADYDKYLELNKGDKDAMVRYAQFLFLVKKYQESLTMIQQLEGSGVKNIVLTRIKGYDMVELGDTVNAVPTLESYFAEQPQEKVLSTDLQYYGRAIALLGNDSLAGEKLMAAAAMLKADPELYSEAGSFFQKARMFDKATLAYQAKVNSPKVVTNDWYYLGGAANKAKQFTVADEAWTKYAEKQPNIYQGYLGRARANVGMDPDKKTWQARPFYEDVIRKMKPEDVTKARVDAEEAYFYLGFYHFYSTKDLASAKCWFEKVKALNAGTNNTKVSNDMLLSKELKDVKAATCEIL